MSAERVALRVRQAPNLIRRALAHPRWLAANVQMLKRRRTEARRGFSSPAEHRREVVSEREALVGSLGFSEDRYEAARAAFWAPRAEGDDQLLWNARPALQSLVSAVVRLLEPEVMVETGVARGYTSAVVLAAMRDNGHGHLYSVDLPALEFDAGSVGRVVPGDLKDRWTLELGPSSQVLPGLLSRVAPVDVFLHDADHTYPSQLEEYRSAWPHLRSGGLLVSDDVVNEAFPDFAAEVGAFPLLLDGRGGSGLLGLMRKH